MEELVTSLSNRWVKLCQLTASSAKERRLSGLALLEGIHLVDSYMASACLSQQLADEVLFLTPSSMQIPEIANLHNRWLGKVVVVSEKVFKAISQLSNGPAVALLMRPPVSGAMRSKQDIVYLCGLQDPGNVGTLIRTAVAAGIEQIACSPETVSLWSPKVLRAAMGGHFYANLIEDVTLNEILAFCCEQVVAIRAMAAQAEQSIYQADLTSCTCWLLGNEGQGLPFELLRNSGAAIEWLSIPQRHVESLNVASAGSVCFYEQLRQRQAKP